MLPRLIPSMPRMQFYVWNEGKAVLCEKPIAVNAQEVTKMIGAAKENNVLFMEGMWSRFPPLMDEVRRMIAEKEIGEVRTIHADFGFRPEVIEPSTVGSSTRTLPAVLS